jgi:histidinol-phosphate aminotransferase
MARSSSNGGALPSAAGPPPAARAALRSLPIYEGGRSTGMVLREHHPTGPVAKLGSNESPYDPLPSVRAAVARAAEEMHRYPDFTGEAVRDALAQHLSVSRGNILLGCGSGHLLQQTFLAYVEAGDEVGYAWPNGYGALPLYTQLLGGQPAVAPLADQTTDLDGLLARVTPHTKLICLTNPNNPTSTAFGNAALHEFLNEIPGNCLVVLDEAYYEYMTLEDRANGVTEALSRPNVIALRTFSKAFGLASLRIGYAVANVDILRNLKRTRFPFTVNGLAQAAAVASLEAWRELQERVQNVVVERERVRLELERRGWPVARSQANFLWLPMEGSKDVATELELTGVITRSFDGGLRVTVGTPQENEAFLNSLDKVQLAPSPTGGGTDV